MALGEGLRPHFDSQPLPGSREASSPFSPYRLPAADAAPVVPAPRTAAIAADLVEAAWLAKCNLLTVGTRLVEAARDRGEISADITRDDSYAAALAARVAAEDALNAYAVGLAPGGEHES